MLDTLEIDSPSSLVKRGNKKHEFVETFRLDVSMTSKPD